MSRFDRDFDRLRRERERSFRRAQLAIVIIMGLCTVAAVWLLFHPEAIGAFVGRVLVGAEQVRA